MLPGDSTVLGTAGSGGDVFAAGLRGFFAAFPVLRLALAVLVTFFRATFFVALRFVFFLAINASSSWCGLLDHIAHRRPPSAIVYTVPAMGLLGEPGLTARRALPGPTSYIGVRCPPSPASRAPSI